MTTSTQPPESPAESAALRLAVASAALLTAIDAFLPATPLRTPSWTDHLPHDEEGPTITGGAFLVTR